MPVVQIDDLTGVTRQGIGIRGEVIAVDADADDERTAEACADDDAGLLPAHDGQAIRAFHECHGILHRFQQIVLVVMGNQVREDFGIGVGFEFHAVLDERVFELGEVFDDAVMNDGDVAGRIEVRVGVGVGGSAVRGPARMADAEVARRRLGVDGFGEFGDPPGFLPQVQFRAGARDQSCRIVAAVFEPLEAVEQNRRGLASSRKTDNSTHLAASTVGL